MMTLLTLKRLPNVRFLSLAASTITADLLERIVRGVHCLTHLELRAIDGTTSSTVASSDRSGLLAIGREDILSAAQLTLDILKRTGKPFSSDIAIIAQGSACGDRRLR